MKTYTVILLYPDGMCENYGQETYMTSVRAKDPEQALKRARAEVCQSNDEDEDAADPFDFFCIAVMEGDHADVNPER